MATPDGRVSYSSLSTVNKKESKFSCDDDCSDSGWVVSDALSDGPLSSQNSKKDPLYKFPIAFEEHYDEDYESDGPSKSVPSMPPEVNLKNVMSGIFAILTGRNKARSAPTDQQYSSPDVSFLGSGKNGETYLHSSVYIPSAPPLLEPNLKNYSAYKDLLDADPPEWLPDSLASVCMQCTAPFTALTRGRHHCRFCGGIFCRSCSKGRCLLPVKFRERNPQRVCDTCYDRLDPLQAILINSISNAVQVAKHDVMDWTCTRGWLNLPLGLTMEHEIYKASNALRSYSQVELILFNLLFSLIS